MLNGSGRCRLGAVGRGDVELIGCDAEQCTEQEAVAGADAPVASFPLGDHVGVDRRVGAVLHPGEVGQFVGELLLSPTRLVP